MRIPGSNRVQVHWPDFLAQARGGTPCEKGKLMVGVLIFAIVIGACAGILASNKGRNAAAWCVIGFLLPPAILVLLCLEKANTTSLSSRGFDIDPDTGMLIELPKTQKCPDCAEVIQVDARICRFCRHEFSANSDIATSMT
jgi:hypothetical protein